MARVGAGHDHPHGSGSRGATGRPSAATSSSGDGLARHIDGFLRERGSPLAGLGSTFVRAGNQHGIDPRFIVAIAGSETSYGTTGNATGIKNPFGWGPHIRFNSFEDSINTVAKGLGGSLYRGAGLTTIAGIGGRWAPVGASNDPTNLNSNWVKNVSEFYRQLGGDPNAPVIGGGAGSPRGVEPARAPSASAPDPAPQLGGEEFELPGTSYLTAESTLALLAWMEETEQQARSGGPITDAPLDSLSFGHMPGDTFRLPTVGGGTPGRGEPSHSHPHGPTGEGDLHGHSEGGVDSGLALRGGTGGNWGGSMPRALEIAKVVPNIPATSQKRSRRSTASGNISDHYVGASNSYAVDLGVTGTAGDEGFRKIASFLGVPNAPIGQYLNVNRGGYRYQVIWKADSGHFDHIHLGVKKV